MLQPTLELIQKLPLSPEALLEDPKGNECGICFESERKLWTVRDVTHSGCCEICLTKFFKEKIDNGQACRWPLNAMDSPEIVNPTPIVGNYRIVARNKEIRNIAISAAVIGAVIAAAAKVGLGIGMNLFGVAKVSPFINRLAPFWTAMATIYIAVEQLSRDRLNSLALKSIAYIGMAGLVVIFLKGGIETHRQKASLRDEELGVGAVMAVALVAAATGINYLLGRTLDSFHITATLGMLVGTTITLLPTLFDRTCPMIVPSAAFLSGTVAWLWASRWTPLVQVHEE